MAKNSKHFAFDLPIFKMVYDGKKNKQEQRLSHELHIIGEAWDNGEEEKPRFNYDATINVKHVTHSNAKVLKFVNVNITSAYLHAALVDSIEDIEDIHEPIMHHIEEYVFASKIHPTIANSLKAFMP